MVPPDFSLLNWNLKGINLENLGQWGGSIYIYIMEKKMEARLRFLKPVVDTPPFADGSVVSRKECTINRV